MTEYGRWIGAGNDRVEVAEAEVLLGKPEVVGQLLLRRLLHDSRPGESDQRAGLRDRDIAERGERREHARGRRMRHHRQHRQPGVVQILDGAHRLRQLHQRQDPLLHPRAARARHRDERGAALDRRVARSRELLADRASHRTAHEREVHHRELDRMARRSSPGRPRSPRRDRCSAPPRTGAPRRVADRRTRAGRRSGSPALPRRTTRDRRTSRCASVARIGKWWPQWAQTQSVASSSSSR